MKKLKVITKQNSLVFLIAMILPFLLSSCTSGTKKEATRTVQSEKIIQANNSKYEIVSNDKVCMVNDRYMVVKQLPVEVNGITYYGCCENCVSKIQNNVGDVRFAKDPTTGEKVDKASAIIVQKKKDGVVYYFKTKPVADAFIKSQG